MAKDHIDYIYDTKNKKVVGNFDGAYENCKDMWACQREVNTLRYRLSLGMLAGREMPASVLDIGCGYGNYVKLLTELGFHATGIDINI